MCDFVLSPRWSWAKCCWGQCGRSTPWRAAWRPPWGSARPPRRGSRASCRAPLPPWKSSSLPPPPVRFCSGSRVYTLYKHIYRSFECALCGCIHHFFWDASLLAGWPRGASSVLYAGDRCMRQYAVCCTIVNDFQFSTRQGGFRAP